MLPTVLNLHWFLYHKIWAEVWILVDFLNLFDINYRLRCNFYIMELTKFLSFLQNKLEVCVLAARGIS